MTTDREKRLEDALAQFLKPMKGIPFEVVIKSLCGTSVAKFDPTIDKNKETLALLVEAMRDACRTVQAKPIERPRPNEVGNDMEPFVIAALTARKFRAAAPKTKGGKGKSTGYPDIKIETGSVPIYLEVKSYAAANHETTQRSFYLSPAEDPKVSDDGYHLLVGFEIERNGNFYTPVAFEIVDLYGLDCDMKAEFNSDNKRLYEKHRILAKERV
jgi:uncharacterized coiled-coil protein SlyX